MFYQFQHFGISEYFTKEYGENYSFPTHLHHSFELVTVLSGKMDVTVENTVYTIYPHDAIIIFPHQLHSISSENCIHMLCIFSTDIVKAFYTNSANKVPLNNKFVLDNFLFNELDKLQESSSVIKKKGLLYSICAAFDENAEYVKRENDEKYLLYKIFKFVETNYTDDCSLRKLSSETGFSYSYISRYFKNILEMSFNMYVNQFRISKACYILNNSDSSILQCSLDCGYKSLRNFNRNFKAILGIAPKEFRHMVST